MSARPGFTPFFVNQPGRGRIAMVMTIAMASGARIKASDRTPQKIMTAAATASSAPIIPVFLMSIRTPPTLAHPAKLLSGVASKGEANFSASPLDYAVQSNH